ncbi:DUF1801 domain-containing protein [Brevundimonas sp.]|jgi:hypothetical protein|uniref:DUF1801 domain-containing protein n=1 Tax=Brevundimonas sp. TaxID=1871086 RepID=UPI003783E60D
MARPASTVDDWLNALDVPTRAGIDTLRAVVRAADPGLTEEIKWNAPSYAHGGRDRVTLGIEAKGGYRIVLHRGAATRDVAGFRFDDPGRLAVWPSPDRGVVRLADQAAIEAGTPELTGLIARWIAATA